MIETYSPVNLRINGIDYKEDVKIIGDKVIPRWWRKNGHKIEEEDIDDIFNADPNILVVGTGYAGNVCISHRVAVKAKTRGIRLISEKTPKAVETFNYLLSNRTSVSGAFHLTC